ncbi:hypothetical protein TGAM01_v210514 [Trichoderma gamsii]|uniref:RNase H type-1 domain-containing protein n=1 Tax=Trichoderma gamsii TaxID=398673 RepID=A0A2P4Z8M6_9HYPO|nr:hypothetical protein TGAM01_v210514 [Trichoderma gamsii]PON20640.1 hypothetical protein TGAM01_v210514 [Trichoderma gamsii]
MEDHQHGGHTQRVRRPKGFPGSSPSEDSNRARFACLDRNHPISRRADRRAAGAPLTRLQRTTALARRTVRPSLFAHNNGAVLPGPDFRGTKKEDAAKKHLLDGLPNSTLAAYSNGSQDELGNTGWGAVTFHKARATKSNGCLPNAEVYDAEAVKAFEAIKLAKERIRADPGIKEIILFLDNSAVTLAALEKITTVLGDHAEMNGKILERLDKLEARAREKWEDV